ncbi:uncharacterized protein comr [Drosophila virilis]|uniref:HSF-type DNA-binding domain-containing protein n=1 Tax=Drosophila virilis TaxID=7244 RepID=B4LM50_DROVI|nr:uncharacterized protein LOC6627162 [Drosophila virilis]EDW60928.1 uncharacterized protein Dvir_GJ20589 [Drosophila virilis]
MSTSKSKRRECNSPVRVLDKQTDDQQVEAVEPSTADNTVQLEFLQFLKSLDEVSHEVHHGVNDCASIEVQSLHSDLALLPQQGSLTGPSNVLVVPAHPATKLQLESLLSHNFVHKLHLAASSAQVTFLYWTADGQQLQLDYIGLQEHLAGGHSMFRSRSILQFVRQMVDVGFERVLQEIEVLEDRPQLYYQHTNFKQGQPEQLLLMPTPQFEQLVPQKLGKPNASKGPIELGTGKDLCSSFQNCYSPLQLARCRFQTLLHYHNDVRLLQEREPNAEQLLPRRGRISSSRQSTQSSLVPALANKHINPRDSVLHFEAGQVPDYAGFYGRVEPSLINEFFAEYLPRYGARTSGYKDIVVDASKANAFQQNLPIGIVYSEDEDDLGDQDSHEVTNIAPAGKHDDALAGDGFNPPPEDIELEQVMQELCGVGPDVEEDPEKKEPTPLKPKLKRKKLVRKCAITDTDLQPESPHDDHGEDLLQAAAAAAAYIKDEQKNNTKDNEPNVNCSTNDAGKDLKCPTAPKSVSKRRRYDLRNSKSKRSR